MTAFQIVALVVCGAVTLTAVALFVQVLSGFVRTFRLGQPESRTDHPAQRWVTLFREFLGHTRMSRLPVVAVAHWFTMVSFGVLFFTLLNAFGQLVDPDVPAAADRALAAVRVGDRHLRGRRVHRDRRADGDPAAATPAPLRR